MEECSPRVLAVAVDFIYGIEIPEDFSHSESFDLLAMADLYLMEDLRDAVGSLIASKHTRDEPSWKFPRWQRNTALRS